MKPPSIVRVFSEIIDPTPLELAQVFCGMDANDQADFFQAIAHEVEKWDRPFCFQLQAIIDNKRLSQSGAFIMIQIGDYGKECKNL